jgi:hypothetical protein
MQTILRRKKSPALWPGSFVNHSNLAVMVMMMVVVMAGVGVGRNHRTSQNDQCDGGKKQGTQFHGTGSLSSSHSFEWSVS